MGIPVYLDEGSHVGVEDQPFWYGGLFYVFKMGPFLLRPNINDESRLPETLRRFDQIFDELAKRGGGVISTYYHPTEFVTTEFWDGVNFSRGANPDRADWKRPRRRTAEDSERAYRILRRYVEHAKSRGARFVTARNLLQIYDSSPSPPLDARRVALHLGERQTFLVQGRWTYSAADLLLTLLNVEPQYVDGPATQGRTTVQAPSISRAELDRAAADAASFIRRHHRLPSQVWIGSDTLSLADFTATLAAGDARIHRGNPECERYVASDPVKTFNWVIHPADFQAPELLELARLQAWTLKPARLR
jgi:hypothetical protein